MIDRRLTRNLDWYILGAVLFLVGMGLLSVYSATRGWLAESNLDQYYYLIRQATWAALGLVGLAAALYFDYHLLEEISLVFYIASIGLLVLVLAVGKVVSSAQSWLAFGPLASLQPSELAKLAVIIRLAVVLQREDELNTWKGLLVPFFYAGVPLALVLLQPDLGTAMVFAGILFGMLFLAGAPARFLAGVIILIATISPIVYVFFLKDYQKARLLAFINPYRDPLHSGFNVIQSMIAIGSGRLFGKGLFSGTQTQLNFVPEHHTDFIFSVIGEEFGFLGSIAILVAYLLVIWRGTVIMRNARERFGGLLAGGVLSLFLFHVLINVGMNLGIMPVTGIPLPFLSYGGSSLITSLTAIGLLLNVGMRRQKILF